MILKNKILLWALLVWGATHSHAGWAQTRVPNMPEHDSKLYYFGLTFGANMSSFRINSSQSFALADTYKVVQPGFGPGFNLGIMGNLRLSKFVDARFIPSLVFAEKKLTLVDMKGEQTDHSVESIYMQLPLQLKFKSDRINNFRFYALVGGKFDYDLAANARSRRQDELLRVSSMDLGGEVGVGFEFFYPNFIFAPEIKLSQGFINTHYADKRIPLSNTIDAMRTRMIVFSIHLQG
ncbi:MAG: porin family protein [Edaphocola sp.]